MPTSLAPGNFLIASPKVDQNPHFARRVVLILKHSPEAGTGGVVINTPLPDQRNASEQHPLVAELEYLQASAGGLFFQGGPMGQELLVMLHRVEHLGLGPPLLAGVYTDGDLEALRAHVASLDPPQPVLRFYLGFASWGPGQLEKEVAMGVWSLCPGSADLVFSAEPEQVWQQARGPMAD